MPTQKLKTNSLNKIHMLENYQKKAVTRLKKANGQINGIIRMIENEKYEPEIMTQIMAVLGALKGVVLLLLESHLQSTGISHMSAQSSRKKDKFIKELLKVFKNSIK